MDVTTIINRFRDNPAIKGREEKFIRQEVKVPLVLASWKESLFSYEWLDADGHVKPMADMSTKIAEKRAETEAVLDDSAKTLDCPVLGIGIMDNIEIGAGKDIFLTLASRGIEVIPVHIPKSHESDFRFFLR